MIGDIISFGKRHWRVIAEQDDRALILSVEVFDCRQFHQVLNDCSWNKSNIRGYLNTHFLNSFTKAEQATIIEQNETTDKIFLLSLEDVKKYSNVEGMHRVSENGWWLRSQGSNSCNVAFVNSNGVVNTFGRCVRYLCGVRPALWLKIAHQTIVFGGLRWLILAEQDNKRLLISEQVLDCKPYHTRQQDITWAECSLRAYLNGEFLSKTFTTEEQAHIIKQNETTDKIFLLSLEEVMQYFGDNDQFNETRRARNTQGKYNYWWLRSPGAKACFAAIVRSDGLVNTKGRIVDDAGGGVRPAMWVGI